MILDCATANVTRNFVGHHLSIYLLSALKFDINVNVNETSEVMAIHEGLHSWNRATAVPLRRSPVFGP